MNPAGHTSSTIGFGVFEVDVRAGELRKSGVKIKLQDQPFQVLLLLLRRPGDVVTREELRQQLWPAETFVDFDTGLNSAVKKLRDALGDSADNPRFIETLPRRGYRFIVPLGDSGEPATQAASSAALEEPLSAQVFSREEAVIPTSRSQRTVLIAAAAGAALLVAILVGWNVGGRRSELLEGTALRSVKSVAVLPLENLTGDPSQEYFADGMTDALITDLAQIRTVRVISRTSIMQYKRARRPLPEIGQELNVDAVVEGTVVRSGERVRIDAQLIYARTDAHLWADSYEGNLQDIVALQNRVASAVAAAIRAQITPDERARLARALPVNPRAYDLYMRGRFDLAARTETGMKKAVEEFQGAVGVDPKYALAYSGLADAYNLLCSFGYLPEGGKKSKEAALKALQLDDHLAEAYTSLAAATNDNAEAESSFRRAIELNPNYALAHHWYARLLSRFGRYDEALTEIRRAHDLDPLSLRISANEGEIYIAAGQYDRAVERLENTLRMDSNYPTAYLDLGIAYYYTRRFDRSLHYLRRAVELDSQGAVYHWWLAVLYEYLGKYREAIAEFQRSELLGGTNPGEASARSDALRKALSRPGEKGYWQEWIALRMSDRAKSPHLYAYNLAYDYAHLGETAEAVRWLQRCYDEGTCTAAEIASDPGLDAIRTKAGYREFLRHLSSSSAHSPRGDGSRAGSPAKPL